MFASVRYAHVAVCMSTICRCLWIPVRKLHILESIRKSLAVASSSTARINVVKDQVIQEVKTVEKVVKVYMKVFALQLLCERLDNLCTQSFLYRVPLFPSINFKPPKIAIVTVSQYPYPQSTTGLAPAELLLGRRPRTRLDLLKPHTAERVESKQQLQKERHDVL